MIKKITVLLLLSITVNSFSQKKIKGNGTITIEKNELKDFKKIILNDDFKVVLVKSDSPSIEIETDENIHGYINYKVYDSVFVLETENKLKPKKAINITLFCTGNLNEIQLHGDSQIESLNTISLSDMFLNINSYAKADLSIKSEKFKFINNNVAKIQLRAKTKLNIESPYVDFLIGGSSNTDVVIRTDSLKINLKEKATLNIEGTTKSLNISGKGNTDLKGKNLNSKNTTVTTNDSSTVTIQTFEVITVEASDKSKLELYGNPRITLNKFSNSAKLHKKEFE